MPICFQGFHQAANVHALRTAAHSAMVVDELHGPEPQNFSENVVLVWLNEGEQLLSGVQPLVGTPAIV